MDFHLTCTRYLIQKDERDRLAAARLEAAGDGGKKKRKGKFGKGKKEQATARAALLDVVERRKFSKKINYAALEGIFGEEPKEPEAVEEEEEVEAPPKRARTVVGGPRKPPPVPKPAAPAPGAVPTVTPDDAPPAAERAVEEVPPEEEEEEYPDEEFEDFGGEEYEEHLPSLCPIPSILIPPKLLNHTFLLEERRGL